MQRTGSYITYPPKAVRMDVDVDKLLPITIATTVSNHQTAGQTD